MVSVRVALLAMVLMLASPLAAEQPPSPAERFGNGESAVATAPPVSPGSQPSAMPKTTAQRLYAARPEVIFGLMVALLLVTAVVLAVRMIVDAYRRR